MPEALRDLWDGLSVTAQDATALGLLLLPTVLVGLVVLRGFRPWGLVRALLVRHRWVSAGYVALIAVSVGLGAGVISQERALREGTARAAQKFDLIVSAPGSEVTMMLAAVYLQPAAVELLDGAAYAQIAAADHVAFAAPIAFGDSFQGAPVVGTTPEFIAHMADGNLAEGRNIEGVFDAVAGALVDVPVGATIEPTHGVPGTALADNDESHGVDYRVVGRLPPTGSPWDRAYLVAVESVWEIHGLGDGHGPGWDGRLGPPFAVDRFPGTPAVLVDTDALWAAYALRSEFSTPQTMAFFPGAVLAGLHGLLGDVRQVLSVMALANQVLVAVAVLTGLILMTRILARRLALLRALGAPRRFVFAVTWSFAAVLIMAGAVLGLGAGVIAARVISDMVTAQTDVLVTARLGWRELHLCAGFVSLTSVLALLPAWVAITRPALEGLKS